MIGDKRAIKIEDLAIFLSFTAYVLLIWHFILPKSSTKTTNTEVTQLKLKVVELEIKMLYLEAKITVLEATQVTLDAKFMWLEVKGLHKGLEKKDPTNTDADKDVQITSVNDTEIIKSDDQK